MRAKRKIRDARIPLSIPADLDERVDALLTVLYLVFNEGYLARGESADAVRVDLVDEAIRLTSALARCCPATPRSAGLLALELYHRARLDDPARRGRRHRAARGSGPHPLGPRR